METKKSAAETSTPSPVPLHPLKEEESNTSVDDTTITTTNTEPTTKKKKTGGAHKKKKKKRTKTSSNNHSNNNKSNGTNKKNQSTSSSLNNNNNRTKKSCHHCRASHLKCDGKRPCSRCVSKKRECIEYDPNLIYSANHETAKNSNHSNNTINHNQCSIAEQQLQKNDDHSDCDDCDTDGDVHMEQQVMKATRRSHHHTRLSDQSSSGPRRKPSISAIRKSTTHDNNSSSSSSKSGSDSLTSRSKRRKMNHRDHSEEEEEEEDNPTLASNNYHSRVLSPDSISHICLPSDSSPPSLDCPLHLSTGTTAFNFVSNDENAMAVDDEKNNMFRDMMVDDENTMGSTYSCSSSCSSPEAIVGEVVCFSGLNYSNPDVYRIVGLFEQDSIPDPVMYDSEQDFMGQYGKNTINSPYTTRRDSSSSLSDSNIDFDHEEMAKRLAFNFSNSFATTSTM